MYVKKNHTLSNHNFYEISENPDTIIQYVMMTVNNFITGNVVGFMESATYSWILVPPTKR